MHKIKLDLTVTQTSSGSRQAAIPLLEYSRSERDLITCPLSDGPRQIRRSAELAIRIMDVTGAAVLLVLLAPALVAISLVILLTAGGPVTFAHRRIGRGGKAFRCYKFRTMYADAEKRLEQLCAENPVLRSQWERDFKLEDDPRVTPIGRFLRSLSLDELPQLVNVIVGDMSLVGPRPITAKEMTRYGRYIAHYLSVRPGLSGIWQVSGRSNTTYRRRVAADVLYVRKRTILLNLKILACTKSAVFDRIGAR